ncbi:porin family protein [Niabella drilacis]|uniref:Outer membrane protein beta-barrel domain-containing protein n=1 Tax=Niabella drilacis (strain DSM 25811 / CCM 8410 / CCUG 62505 / LMG 26954 / E90) TaxID=1285928 RepID=A0A1G6YRF7_NIADE|nr:porin family protein [Niabella drilacis]SDD93084.1 Outer membrane protein beta-barrel domain-containing protein [Niabella drilacis]
MNDEELDQLFRDAANRFQPPDAPEGAWDAFYKTKMLPAAENTQQDRFFIPRRTWQLAAACLLLVATGLLWMLWQHPVPAPGGTRPGSGIAAGPLKSKTILPSEAAPLPPAPGNTRTNDRSLSSRSLPTVLFETKEQPVVHNSQHLPGAPPTVETERKLRPADTVKPGKPYLSLRDKHTDGRPAHPALPQYYNQSSAGSGSSISTANASWQVGLLAGSNLGMVRGDVSKKPGLNAGVLVQKKLGQSRFSLESGVIYESMTYAVNNEDFNPNGQPVSSKVSNIEGSCSMIDVPVNLRYDVVASRKNKAFVSTGVSPTVIVKQSYVYDFDRGDGPVPVTRDVSGKGKSVYAVANLSIGYEQKWEHVSVQIAPYVKIPVGEIGYGNLSLGGVGTQISIKKDL